MDGGVFRGVFQRQIHHELLAVCRHAAGFRRPDIAPGVCDRRKSVRLQHVAGANGLLQDAEGIVPELEHPAGIHLSGAGDDQFRFVEQLGAPRFAAGAGDSIYVGGGSAGYYRVLLLRQ